MKFVKMHGCGNDYVYLDAVRDAGVADVLAKPGWPDLVRSMSHRHTGIGSDGVIVVCPPTSDAREAGAVARMRMFNSDGSEAQMCGNGIRCVAKFVHDRLGERTPPMRIETRRGILSISYETAADHMTRATVDMGEPILAAAQIPVRTPRGSPDRVVDVPIQWLKTLAEPQPWMQTCALEPTMTCVSMGNPHVVLWCKWRAKVPLETIGEPLGYDPRFPEGCNVHFASAKSRQYAGMRTWERGAGMTQACGTGACAVLVAGVLTNRLDRDSAIEVPGGELRIRWDQATNHVFMTGEAVDVFEGEWPDL